jgi:hypothetical protein
MMPTSGFFQVSCPNDHLVRVPAGLAEEELVCPQCSERFVAHAADSLEAGEDRVERAARQWLWVAVAAAVLLIVVGVGAFLAGMLS